jgi:hypothetical protein
MELLDFSNCVADFSISLFFVHNSFDYYFFL